MLFIEITSLNLDLCTALNDGVVPKFELNGFGGRKIHFLVITPGKPNRIVEDKVFRRFKKFANVQPTQKRMYYAH